MKLTKVQRATLQAMFGGLCAYCGEPLGDRWHADHVEPVQRYKPVINKQFLGESWKEKGVSSAVRLDRPENDTFENLMPACAPCNISKGPLRLDAWRDWLTGHVRSLNAHNTPYRLAKKYGLIQETGAPIVFHFERLAQKGGAA